MVVILGNDSSPGSRLWAYVDTSLGYKHWTIINLITCLHHGNNAIRFVVALQDKQNRSEQKDLLSSRGSVSLIHLSELFTNLSYVTWQQYDSVPMLLRSHTLSSAERWPVIVTPGLLIMCELPTPVILRQISLDPAMSRTNNSVLIDTITDIIPTKYCKSVWQWSLLSFDLSTLCSAAGSPLQTMLPSMVVMSS